MLSPNERRLAESHRVEQVRLAAATVLEMDGLFRLFDDTDAWLRSMVRLIEAQHGRSAALSRRYIRNVRLVSVGSAPAGVLPQPGLPVEAVRTSLFVRGPLIVERARRLGTSVEAARRLARAESARAGTRHVANGGRDTITQYARTDRRAGWARVTSGNSCDFCSMLAGRGAVYSRDTVDFEAHDGCNCSGALEFR